MTHKAIRYQGRYIRAVEEGTWEYVERVHSGGEVAGIVALTPAREIVLVEQYRIPLGCRAIELPAGLVGDLTENESAATAAARELEEETGYRAGRLDLLVSGASSSGLVNETMHLFYAHDLEKTGEGGGDEHEDILVHTVPLHSVRTWLDEKHDQGFILDIKIYAGLFFAANLH